MTYKKLSIFVMVLIITGSIFSQPDDNNNTELIDFMKQRNEYLLNLHKEVDEFSGKSSWYKYNNQNNYYDTQRELRNFEKNSLEQMMLLIEQGAPVNAIDQENKTSLDYAQSYETYRKLRACGADFQIKPFIYFHPKTTASITMIVMAIAYSLYEVDYLSPDRFAKYGQKVKNNMMQTIDDIKKLVYSEDQKQPELYNPNDLHSKDAQGRTPLMNYLIEQEQTLLALRDQIIILHKNMKFDEKNKEAKKLCLHAVLEHQTLCEKTRTKIKAMIDQGAAVDIEDIFGKSLLNHCYTTDIYNDLRDAGTPFEIKPWLYFKGAESLIVTIIAAGCIGLAGLFCKIAYDDMTRFKRSY